MDSTRASLLDRLRDNGDRAAWREFEAKYRDLVLRFCHRRGLQHWDAEDVFQIVLLQFSKVLARGFQYRPATGRFRAYLGRATRNAIFSLKTRPNIGPAALREMDDELLATLPADDEEADPEFEQEWRDHHLRMAVASLENKVDARDFQLFDRLLKGESMRDLARHFELTETAAYKIKQRLRDRLRSEIARQIRDEDGLDTEC